MLICKKCFLEYNEENNFCSECGGPLSPKQIISSAKKELSQEEEERPKEKFICPQCKIIYEMTTTCIRCGREVVPLSCFHEEKEKATVEEVEEQFESQTIEIFRSTNELIETPLSPKTDKSGLENSTSPSEGSEKKGHAKTMNRVVVSRRPKRDYRRLSFYLGELVIMIIAGGYLLWSLYIHLFSKEVSSKTKNAKEPTVQELSSSSSSPPSFPSSSPSSSMSSLPITTALEETETIRKIRELLENIRKANLHQDIELFLSCYSKDFKDREGKKRATLESWKKFNYIELSYHLKKFSLSSETARAIVVWFIKYCPKSGGPSQENKTTLEVLFQKEEEEWKIREIIFES